MAPGSFQFNFRMVIFKLTLVNGGWGISYEIALRWMPQDFTEDKSTLFQVMSWCHQASRHYLSPCQPRSMSPNGVTRLQWVKALYEWPLQGKSLVLDHRCETIFWPPYILTPGSIYRTTCWPRGQYIVKIFWLPSRYLDPLPIIYKTVLLVMDNY